MSIFDTLSGATNNIINGAGSALNSAQSLLSQNNPLTASQQESFKSDGFLLPANFSSDGTGLPYNNVSSYKPAQLKRNIISWFVPEFGVVKMYVNPQQIVYTYKKLIHKDRTKGGYTLQYWGEDLGNINISGITGSSGIEGINVLYEIYRAEQYAFDTTGLTIAANNMSQNISNNVFNSISSGIDSSVGKTALSGLLGLDSSSGALSSNNYTSLAQLAFTVEMYYNGWVFRGFFEDMTITESTNFLWDYRMSFTVTQKRGYRQNYFPFTRSAKDGPSQYTTPNSFSGNIK